MTNRSDPSHSARLALIDEHIGHENRHDLDGIMGTFGSTARYDDEALGAHYSGHEGVRGFYAELLAAMPDLHIEVRQRHAGDDAVVLETVIRGRHLGPWRGLPATGRPVEVPLCAVFTFDDQDRLAGEKIYYDRASVLRQLGVLHEPERLWGRIATALMHPLTMARILRRKLRRMG